MGAPRGKRPAAATAAGSGVAPDVFAGKLIPQATPPKGTKAPEQAPNCSERLPIANKTPFKTPLKGINTRVNSEAKFKAMLEELDVEVNAQCREMTHAAQVRRQNVVCVRG
jgi:hypothetical protein